MRSSHAAFAIMASAAAIAAASYLARAGDLNPPAGPVSPTMLTLEDLGAQLAAASTPTWEHTRVTLTNSLGPGDLVLPGSGVLHAIIIRPFAPPTNLDAQVEVRVGDCQGGGDVVGIFEVRSGATDSLYIPLNIRYGDGGDCGLYLRSLFESGENVTVLYRPDAPN